MSRATQNYTCSHPPFRLLARFRQLLRIVRKIQMFTAEWHHPKVLRIIFDMHLANIPPSCTHTPQTMHAPFDKVGVIKSTQTIRLCTLGVMSVLSRQSPESHFRVRIVLKKKIAKISVSLDGTLEVEDGLQVHFREGTYSPFRKRWTSSFWP